MTLDQRGDVNTWRLSRVAECERPLDGFARPGICSILSKNKVSKVAAQSRRLLMGFGLTGGDRGELGD